jgi:Tfp pilus assembly protein PilF
MLHSTPVDTVHRLALFLLVLCLLPGWAGAAPFTPASDDQVLERLPSRAADPIARELRDLRQQLAQRPEDVELAVRLARRSFDAVAAEGDPRYIGHAQAALAPWWALPAPPADVRVMRAKLRQFDHQFDAARADLAAVVAADPGHADAWAWLAAIAMVQARYADAREACRQLAPLSSALTAAACTAAVDAVTGRAGVAVLALEAALAAAPQATAEERLWALTRLAETMERLGRDAEAEAAYRSALALGITDGYLLAAYADFLLDRGRPADVIELLAGKQRSDLLLLRLTLAGKASGAPAGAGWAAELSARFDAARRRGDALHQKEEARYLLAVAGDPQRALPLAQANFAVQREPADARVLLEAALAAGQPAAAAPVLQWMADSGVESRALTSLADRIKDKP